MVAEAFAHPSTKAAMGLMPGFVRRPVPVEHAVDAIELAIRKRRARVWAPRYVGLALAARGWLQPLTEKRVGRAGKQLERALELAQPVNRPADHPADRQAELSEVA
jgi:hypothetical protein